jgi:unspecific monooxygenase
MTTQPAPTSRALEYDPWDPAFIADPYPALARLRDGPAAVFDERTNQWLVARHAHVNALLRDRRLGRSYLHVASHEEWGRPGPPPDEAALWDLIGLQLIDKEPPDHTRLRRLVLAAFTPRTVEALRPQISAMAAELVDRAAGKGRFDLIGDVLERLPVMVIAELLGIPEQDRDLLRPWSGDMTLVYELDPTPQDRQRAVIAGAEFEQYLRSLIQDRRRAPGRDLLSALTAEAGAGDRLTDDEVVGTAVLLLNAGHEASVNGTANSWYGLLTHEAALAALRRDAALVPSAVDELLRFDTPAPMFERWVLEDIEVDGIRISRGQEIALQFAAANRDPGAFDRPDDIILDRRPNPYLSFGAGIHYCLGAPLAKLESEIIFRSILERLPRLELVEEPRWKPRFILRGLQALIVQA